MNHPNDHYQPRHDGSTSRSHEVAIGHEYSDNPKEDEGNRAENIFDERSVSQHYPEAIYDVEDEHHLTEAFEGNLKAMSSSPSGTTQIQESLTIRGLGAGSKRTSYPPFITYQLETHCFTGSRNLSDGLEQNHPDHETQNNLILRREVEHPTTIEFVDMAPTNQKDHKPIRNHQPSRTIQSQSQRPPSSTNQHLVSQRNGSHRMIPVESLPQHQQGSSDAKFFLSKSDLAKREGTDNTTIDSHDNVEPSIFSPKRPITLDYSYSQLRQMSYEDLRQENFDQDPQARGHNSAQSLANSELSSKLQEIFDITSGPDLATQREAAFASLNIEQFENCGDLIIDKFNSVMARYVAARVQKRKVARAFEDEVANREKAIQAKKKAIDDDLGRLRNAGQDVVRGRRPLS